MNGDPKYKLFRNFMVNELQISREDIRLWVAEAITAQLDQMIRSGELKIDEIARREVARSIQREFEDSSIWGRSSFRKEVLEVVAQRLVLSIRSEGKSDG
jgi:hypothetical protein